MHFNKYAVKVHLVTMKEIKQTSFGTVGTASHQKGTLPVKVKLLFGPTQKKKEAVV